MTLVQEFDEELVAFVQDLEDLKSFLIEEGRESELPLLDKWLGDLKSQDRLDFYPYGTCRACGCCCDDKPREWDGYCTTRCEDEYVYGQYDDDDDE